MKFTKRMKRIIERSEKEAGNVLLPGHLLIASLQEKTGVLGEISLKCDFKLNSLRDTIDAPSQSAVHSCYFNIPVSSEVEMVMEAALGYMQRYKQIYLNEGHLLKALITTKVVDSLITENEKKIILEYVTVSRDMITHLETLPFPILANPLIRRVTKGDYHPLITFVEQHFSAEWANTIIGGFQLDEPTMYIAFDGQKNIIGFAAYDVYQNKKNYFGPMGIAMDKRSSGIGKQLLFHCLRDMKEMGYEYAIIGGAGPMEFYEKNCNAVVIPRP